MRIAHVRKMKAVCRAGVSASFARCAASRTRRSRWGERSSEKRQERVGHATLVASISGLVAELWRCGGEDVSEKGEKMIGPENQPSSAEETGAEDSGLSCLCLFCSCRRGGACRVLAVVQFRIRRAARLRRVIT